jgi:putative ABC transport system ATP-binding protein
MATSSAVSPLLRMDAVRFQWPGAARPCLALEHFEIMPGETVFVRGPSGGGKSTLLSLAAGVLTTSSGSVALLGKSWQAMPAAQRDRIRGDHIGYIFQQFNLLPYLSALDNVLLTCQLSHVRATRAGGPGLALLAAQSLLRRVGFDEVHWHRRAAELSVGQQQRVAAARALIGKPELVIADEPTSALDEAMRDNFMALLMQSCRDAGSALLFVSHDGRLVHGFDRVVDLVQLNRVPAGLKTQESLP